MSQEESTSAVVRVGLRRVALDERVLSDEELRRAPCARILGEPLMRELVASGVGKRFPAGARLFLAADGGDSIFLLLKGEVRLSAGRGVVEVGTAHKGDLIGESEELGEGPVRTCSATAVGEVEVVELPRTTVDDCARREPAFGEYLSNLATGRAAAGAEMAEFLARW